MSSGAERAEGPERSGTAVALPALGGGVNDRTQAL
jgi:hypothetical protein